MAIYTAFDIGGTYLKFGIVEGNRNIKRHNYIKTPESLDKLLEIIGVISDQYRNISEGIAISSPGAVSENGIIYGASALDYLHGPNIKKLISDRTELPVHIENDGNCAAYAEMWAGAAQNISDFIMMVIGTGVGGAIIKDRKLHKGANLHGGEIGLMLFNDDLSDNGWARMESTISLVRKVEELKNMEKGSLTGEDVFRLAESGDQDCIKSIDRFYRLLSMGIFNLQYVYDPEVILIGGGISSKEELIPDINKYLDEIFRVFSSVATIRPRVKVADFRQNANLLGAVYGFMKEGQHV